MRKFLIVAALLLAALGCGKPKTQTLPPDAPIQQKATHMITFLDYRGERDGLCTGTAIGPHAILTATHCDDDRSSNVINLDLSTHKYHIQKFLTDDRDHDIYLIDGSPLRNIVTYAVRTAVRTERVFLYGHGEGTYPSRRLDGLAQDYFYDPSDVDEDQGEVQFTLHVIPGDSGSAVFGMDGKIVGITTYSYSYKKSTSVDFAPSFTPRQIAEALTYEPSDKKLPAISKPPCSLLEELFGK